MSLSLQEKKRLLRAEARKRGRTGESGEVTRKLMENFLQNIRLEKGAVVASYCAVHDEMNMTVLNETLCAKGHPIALPVITGKGKPMIFRIYQEGDRLLANPLGILEPTSAAQGVEPDVLLIPLVAFDRRLNRLGYGGGYYDRTIKKLRIHKPILTLGIAYACQEITEIPVGPNDVPLDKIITETDVF
jgi:5-formyltetrahydrofolate cyclo-ligase